MVDEPPTRAVARPAHTGSVDVRLMQMTPDERAADAVALVQRIQARLAAARAIEYEAEE